MTITKIIKKTKILGGVNMSLVASILSGVGSFFSNLGSQACAWWWVDEPECPKSLIK